jgi:hypothetical protein
MASAWHADCPLLAMTWSVYGKRDHGTQIDAPMVVKAFFRQEFGRI